MITFNSGHVSGLAWFISLNFSISESELVLRLPIRLNPNTKLSISLFFKNLHFLRDNPVSVLDQLCVLV